MTTSRAWMPLYIGDYLADTAELSTEEHGAYLLLMMHYWRTGPLPADDNRLKNICGLSKHKFSKFKPVFLKFFSLENDKYFHGRIEREIAKATEISKKRAEAGSLGGQASAEAKQKLLPTQSQSQSHKHKKEKKNLPPAEPSADPWKDVFDLVEEVVGKESRSLAGKLKQVVPDPIECFVVIEQCRGKDNPKNYLAGAIKGIAKEARERDAARQKDSDSIRKQIEAYS